MLLAGKYSPTVGHVKYELNFSHANLELKKQVQNTKVETLYEKCGTLKPYNVDLTYIEGNEWRHSMQAWVNFNC